MSDALFVIDPREICCDTAREVCIIYTCGICVRLLEISHSSAGDNVIDIPVNDRQSASLLSFCIACTWHGKEWRNARRFGGEKHLICAKDAWELAARVNFALSSLCVYVELRAARLRNLHRHRMKDKNVTL